MLTWFITGGSRGLGREIALRALDDGDAVVATARNPQAAAAAFDAAGDRLRLLPLDVTVPGQPEKAVADALEAFGQIDVLVNNAGRGLLGAVEEVSDTEARDVFDTNVFGMLAVLRAALPAMRERGTGTIVQMSSVGGFTQGPGWGVYGATKCALEGISESLHAELAPLGIKLLIVEPGVFRTDFLDASSLHEAKRQLHDYDQTAGRTRAWVHQNNHLQAGDAAKAAAVISRAVRSSSPPLRLQLGADCIARVEGKISALLKDLDEWRDLASATAHEDVVSGKANGVPGYWE